MKKISREMVTAVLSVAMVFSLTLTSYAANVASDDCDHYYKIAKGSQIYSVYLNPSQHMDCVDYYYYCQDCNSNITETVVTGYSDHDYYLDTSTGKVVCPECGDSY